MRVLIGLCVLVLFAAQTIGVTRWDFMARLENFAYDKRLLLTMPRTADDRIVIVDIDEKSLAREGRWPWSRKTVARLMDQLFETYGIYVVGLDVVFAEPEESTALRLIKLLQQSELNDERKFQRQLPTLREAFDHDRMFARSLEGRNVVLGLFFGDADASGEIPRAGVLPPPLFPLDEFAARDVPFVRSPGYAGNLAMFQQSASAAGHHMYQPDSDGVVRRVPMLHLHRGGLYEALSLAVTRVALKVDQLEYGPPAEAGASGYSSLEWLSVGGVRVPVDERAQALVPYRGRRGSFPYVSATDVLNGSADPETLRGRIVLIGATAEGLLDLRATPVGPKFPGVEVHANLISGILDDSIKHNPAYAVAAEFVLLLVSGVIMAMLLPLLSPLWASATTLALLAGILGVNLAAWQYANLAFPVSAGLLAILVLFLFNMSWGFFIESRGKRQLANRFGQYVPPELVDEMSKNPEAFSMDTRNQNLTVLFSDVRDFTTISEQLTPSELSRLMNEYLSPMTKIIYDHRGTIDKYMGDAIMAFWGAPVVDPEHARHGLQAAVAMSTKMRELRAEFGKRGWPEIRIGIGLNTGQMNVGNMGSRYRVAYTVMGDAVNIGSRLEGLTKGYGVEIIVSEATRNAVPEYAYLELDRVRVKGKDEPVTIYEPVGLLKECDQATRQRLKTFSDILRSYRARMWDDAETRLRQLAELEPNCRLCSLYLSRITAYRASPPEAGWDGVFVHSTK